MMTETVLGRTLEQREAWDTIRELVGKQQRFQPRQAFSSQRGGQRFTSLQLFSAALKLASGGDIIGLLMKFLEGMPDLSQALSGKHNISTL